MPSYTVRLGMLRRRGQSTLDRPSICESLADGSSRKAQPLGPLRQCERLASERQALPLPDRGCQYAINRPARFQSFPQGAVGDPRLFAPIGDALCAVPQRQESGIAPIVRLLMARRPSAIRFGIRSVVVDAIQRMTGTRARAHIAEKRAEVVLPFVADRNPARSVVGVIFRILIATTLLRPSPDGELGAMRHPVDGGLVHAGGSLSGGGGRHWQIT